MKILCFAGSLQKDSLNKKLAQFANSYLNQNYKSEYVDLKPLNIPIYDGDDEKANGLPEGVKRLAQLITESSALVISTPEYNGSISSPLKNTIDWLSRSTPQPLKGKHVLLLAATPGSMNGIRTLWHSRVPFEALGCHVYPEMVGIGKASEILTADNQIKDEKIKANLERVLIDFITHASKK